LEDFYAFCRVADDLADEPDLSLEERMEGLDSLRHWVLNPEAVSHPFWNRLWASRQKFNIPDRCFLGLLHSLRMEIESLQKDFLFETWEDLNAYIQGVACDVGEVVLCILEKPPASRQDYAQNLGRCVQYLNILRDLDEDEVNHRRYFPREALRPLGISINSPLSLTVSEKQRIREELFRRAQAYYEISRTLPIRSWIAELMINFYRRAALRYWRFGKPQRLSRSEKLKVLFLTLLKV
jgi:phytoene/squalene synthetase